MEIRVVEQGDAQSQVCIHGPLTASQLSPVGDPLRDRLGPEIYSRRLLIDLSETPFIDSCGVGWLLQTHKRFRQSSGQLVLHSLSPVVAKTLALLSLHGYFQIAPSAATAEAGKPTP